MPEFGAYVPGAERMDEILALTAERLQDNYPYFHPLYAGQMLKPPHPVARLAYALAMNINPNNHALDGGRATSAMEKEAVSEIAAMFGWDTLPGTSVRRRHHGQSRGAMGSGAGASRQNYSS